MRWVCSINSSFCLNGFYDLWEMTQPKASHQQQTAQRVSLREQVNCPWKKSLFGNITQKMFAFTTDQSWTGFSKIPLVPINCINSQLLLLAYLSLCPWSPAQNLGTWQLIKWMNTKLIANKISTCQQISLSIPFHSVSSGHIAPNLELLFQ